ncbi:MAG: RNA polymerase subunit sigma-24 [Candidatus Tectimicrobiota bacterium]|nr:MAG: RNA polymerase subunit sigma-24 [Candidatus Tectomicrobia bacterium]
MAPLWRRQAAAPADAALMQRVVAGDAEAFAQLVRRYEHPLYNYLRRMVQDEALAADLLQETWLRLFQHAHRYDPARPLSTWLFAIAYHSCLDALRQRQRRQVVTSAAAAPGPADPQRALLAQEAQAAVRAAVASLPPAQRAVLLLRHYHGLSYQEIAAVVQCPVGTVKSRLHHALRHLQQTLAAWGVVENAATDRLVEKTRGE